MLDKIIHFSIHNKFIIGLLTLSLIVIGSYSMYTLPIDALPDITNNQVQVITTSPKLATQEVEQFITYPIEQSVKSIPGVIELRSISRFGLSVITVVFEEHVDIYWARTQISQRLTEAQQVIPEGIGMPEMAPVSTGLGEIYQYIVFPAEGYEDQYSAMELRTIQDWIIKPQLLGTKGVAEVNTLGGQLKQYEIAVKPDQLNSMNVTMSEIFDALQDNNENTGGAYIDKKPYAYFIRGIGMISSIEDIKKIVVKNQNNIPILINDVATVQIGSGIRYGAVTKDGKGEDVQGMVMMLKGANSAEVVATVKERMEQIKKSLPEGVLVEPFLDRTVLVDKAISTVSTNLIEGALIVIFILVLLLGNWRAGLVVASVIPLSLLFAISMMRLFGVSGNLMSLGAIDFGLIVDGSVIIVESIVHKLQIGNKGKLTRRQMDNEVYQASSKIRNSAAFGEIIILIVYLPILALVGIEGKMFGPMAQTVSFAILGAFLLSLTYVPMMSALALKKQTGHKKNFSDKIIEKIYSIYEPILNRVLQIKASVVAISLALFVASLFIFNSLGGEFIPTLDEGDIAAHLIIASGSSLSQEIESTTKAEKLLKENFPEIKMIVSKIGSAEIPTDPMPMEAADMIIILKDKKEWTSAKTKEELMQKMEKVLESIPGAITEFSQPIQMRFNELMTGVRSDVAVKIFGDDIDLLVAKGDEVVKLIEDIPGITDIQAERVAGLPQITIRYNKDKLALYGLKISELNRVVRMGFAGEVAGVVYEGEKRFDMVVRLDTEKRSDIEGLRSLFITLPSGSQIPLGQVADINFEDGPMQISREDGKRRIVVGFNVRGTDVKSVVEEIQTKLDSDLKLPDGYYTTYGGQFENLIDANKRLAIAVPIALALIFILLYFTFKSISQALLIFSAIPLAAIGGIIALWLRDMPFSISAGVGFIALFGVAVLNGIVLISQFNYLKADGMTNVYDRIREGTKIRLRPVIMTAAVASLGFLPMALSSSAGAEVQKPLATVVIGGLITATLLTLLILPIGYFYLEHRNSSRLSKKSVALIILLCGLPMASFAQEKPKYNLDQVLEIGLQNNLSIQESTLAKRMQSELLKTGFEIPKTEFDAQFGQLNTLENDLNLSVSQKFNPFKISAKRNLLRANLDASSTTLQVSKQQFKTDLRGAWNNLMLFETQQKLLQKHNLVLKELVRTSTIKYKAGDTNSLESSLAHAKQLEFEQKIMRNLAQVRAQKNVIKTLINVEADFEIEDTSFVPLRLLSQIDTTAVNQNSNIVLANNSITIAEANRKVERAELFPELSAGYFIQSIVGNHDDNGQAVHYGNELRFQGFSVGVALPIFVGSNLAKARAARTNVLREEMNLKILKSQLLTEIHQLNDNLAATLTTLKYYEDVASANAKLISKNADKAYKYGEIGYTQYVQMIEMALEIELNHLKAIHNYNQTVINALLLTNQ